MTPVTSRTPTKVKSSASLSCSQINLISEKNYVVIADEIIRKRRLYFETS